MNFFLLHKIGGLNFAEALRRLQVEFDAEPFAAFVAATAEIDEPVARCEVATELFQAFTQGRACAWLDHTDPRTVLQRLVAARFDLDWRDRAGKTLLHHAAGFRNPTTAQACCDYLVEMGAAVAAVDEWNARPIAYARQANWNGFSVLCDLVRQPLTSDLHRLAVKVIRHKRQVDAVDLRTGDRPLHLVLLSPQGRSNPQLVRDDLVEIILREGASPNLRNGAGYTALHLAAANPENERLREKLILAGADETLCDHTGRSAAAIAVLTDRAKQMILCPPTQKMPVPIEADESGDQFSLTAIAAT